MLKELERIVETITTTENDLKGLEKQVLELDMERLNETIKIAMKGFKWEYIYTLYERIECYNSHNNIYYEDKYENFNDKGILLDATFLDNDIKRELWLLKNGEFKVYDIVEKNLIEKIGIKKERYISQSQEIEQFDFDTMMKSIYNNLTNKLKNLGNRTKAQMNRLEKLKALEIKL